MQFCISRIALRLSLLIFALNVTWLQGAHRSKRVLKTEITEYAKPHSKPWMAILLRPNRYRDDAYIPCGAFLINRPPYLHDSVSRGSSDLLLTAGHCLVDNGRLWSRKEQIRHTPDKFTVFLGKHNASGYEDTEQRFHVINSIVHKKYVDINDPKYDIGLIQLNRKVAFNEFIKPIPLIKLKPKLKTNCSMSGWGSKHALEDTWNFGAQGRYGLFSTLATAYFSDATMNDSRIQYKNVSKERRTINGDSGSPLVCQIDNHTVARGIAHGWFPENGSIYETFTNIRYLLPWIKWAIRQVDITTKMYHEDLIPYDQAGSQNDEFLARDFEQTIKNRTDNRLLINLDKKFLFPHLDRSCFTEEWFSSEISHKFKVYKEKFNVVAFRGYSTEDTVYNCAVLCYMANPNGSCSYVPRLKRCYLSAVVAWKKKILLDVSDTVSLCFGNCMKSDSDIAQAEVVDQLKSIDVLNDTALLEVMFDVSVRFKSSGHHHCEGVLRSSRAHHYDYVDLSSDCMEYFRTYNDDIEVHVLNLPKQSTSFVVQAKLIEEENVYKLMLLQKVPLVDTYGPSFGRMSPSPMLRRYDPYNGAFLALRAAAPWMVFVEMIKIEWERYKLTTKCLGLLLDNVYSFEQKDGFTNRLTNAVLITNECTMDTEDSQFFVTSKPTPSSLQKSDICAISSNSAGLTVGTLCTGIKFGSTVHPIILPSIEVYGTKNYTYSIVATDDKTVIAGFRMIYEIPVKIIGLSMVNGVEKVRTSRIFFHRSGAAAEPIELKWGILVAHDTSPGRPILVGMNATTIRKTSFEHIEEHTLIEPFSQWIGRALT